MDDLSIQSRYMATGLATSSSESSACRWGTTSTLLDGKFMTFKIALIALHDMLATFESRELGSSLPPCVQD